MAGVGRLGWEGGFTVETGKTRSHEKSQNNMSCTSIQLHTLLGLWHGMRLFRCIANTKPS